MVRENGKYALVDLNLASGRGGEVVGVSDNYAPPESLRVNPDSSSARGQVYNLGMIAYEMLGGKVPGREERALGFSPKGLEGLSDGVSAVFTKAISHKPEDRYETPGEFAEALKKLPQ